MLKCSVCGEELNEGMNFCPGCGASVKGKNNSTSPKNKEKRGSSSESKRLDSGKNNQAGEVKTNSLSTTKLFYLFLVLFLIGALLVYSSGVFETNSRPAASQQGNTSQSASGVNLNNLDQINSLQAAVDANPNDKNSLLQLAHLYNDSGMKEKAIERYTQYLKSDPKNTDVLVDMGVCYYETGKSAQAISFMEKALKINPRHQIANLNLGVVNMSIGNSEKAKKYWKQAIEIDSVNEIGQRAKELLTSH